MYSKYTDNPERIAKVESNYDATARKNFSKPALVCQMCGGEMTDHKDPMADRWQKRWSIHQECAAAAENQLDRATGILTERKERP